MSIMPMYRRCRFCGHRYTYNPSVGNFGDICPLCGRSQFRLMPPLKPFNTKRRKHP